MGRAGGQTVVHSANRQSSKTRVVRLRRVTDIFDSGRRATGRAVGAIQESPADLRSSPHQNRRTSPKFPRHCEEGKARRGNPHPKQCEALPAPAGVGRGTDCHVASLLAMTVVVAGWSFRLATADLPASAGGSMPRPYIRLWKHSRQKQ